jgi:uncharacterized membrane protein YtjA (UPF0391 family)
MQARFMHRHPLQAQFGRSRCLPQSPINHLCLLEDAMLYWSAIFLIMAIASALLGFGGAAVSLSGIGQILCFVFLIAAVLSLILSVARRRA